MGLLRRNRASDDPPAASHRPPTGLSMKLESTFFIGRSATSKPMAIEAVLARKTPGTILVGELMGEGALMLGDVVVCAAGRFPIKRIEVFKQLIEQVGPQRNVALGLGPDVDAGLFHEGEQLRFER